MQLIKAFILCIIKHWKQKDKAGKRYVYHPIYVMLNVKGYKEKVVALLHDIVEDTDVTIDKLKKAGFSKEIVKAVEVITKKKNQEYFRYLTKVKNNKIAKSVKIEDLKHNMNLKRIKNISGKDYKRFEKYKEALKILEN
ncbi:hypothetical protein [Pseudoleptotrichia goodfellowii]|jgi:putative GTP diphosphokinase|uniref:HD domain protein n=1 Tax=Pseudoleptotrichia goodfellowii F0264 TaxID=596323 RepID=D0GMR7_9FUSO|nr:hypothetical protein [Pseudoleptotrichia goodfellowii]EEY34600.1 hypothetical protein HMPREF0554_0160 [Pseudoleptotrichia goodfellowii F0264]